MTNPNPTKGFQPSAPAPSAVVTGYVVERPPAVPGWTPTELDYQQRWNRSRINCNRCIFFSFLIHALVFVLVNTFVWIFWHTTDHSKHETWQHRVHEWTGYDLPEDLSGHYDDWSCPWPAWVTFGTGIFLLFHAVNTLPLLCKDRASLHWNYWVCANLSLVIASSWIIFACLGGFRSNDMYVWPWWVTAACVVTLIITSVSACLCCCFKRP